MTIKTTSSSELSADTALIPKRIHFIWIGGTIPKKYLTSILKLEEIAKRDGFELNVWTDNAKNIEKPLTNLLKHLDLHIAIQNTELSYTQFGLKIRNINELKQAMNDDILYQEEDRFKKYWSCVTRESVGFKNFAAASDFLRYEILRQQGGYYFDTDTEFQVTRNSKLITESPSCGIKLNIHVYAQTKIYFYNNDIIAALPKNPMLSQMIKKAIDLYDSIDERSAPNEVSGENFKTIMDLKRQPSTLTNSERASLTSTITGPDMLLKVIQQSEPSLKAFQSICASVSEKKPSSKSDMNIQFAGITVKSGADLTWLKKKKSNIRAFDDTSIPLSISKGLFSHHYSIKKNSTTVSNDMSIVQRMEQSTLQVAEKKLLLGFLPKNSIDICNFLYDQKYNVATTTAVLKVVLSAEQINNLFPKPHNLNNLLFSIFITKHKLINPTDREKLMSLCVDLLLQRTNDYFSQFNRADFKNSHLHELFPDNVDDFFSKNPGDFRMIEHKSF